MLRILIALLGILVAMMPSVQTSGEESIKPRTERAGHLKFMEGFLWPLNARLAIPIALHHIGVFSTEN